MREKQSFLSVVGVNVDDFRELTKFAITGRHCRVEFLKIVLKKKSQYFKQKKMLELAIKIKKVSCFIFRVLISLKQNNLVLLI